MLLVSVLVVFVLSCFFLAPTYIIHASSDKFVFIFSQQSVAVFSAILHNPRVYDDIRCPHTPLLDIVSKSYICMASKYRLAYRIEKKNWSPSRHMPF